MSGAAKSERRGEALKGAIDMHTTLKFWRPSVADKRAAAELLAKAAASPRD
ncbi:hypothetical protein JOC69_000757 [Heliobacterium gestii]|nr:hypothetical protein [Heliomicrobium gestii]